MVCQTTLAFNIIPNNSLIEHTSQMICVMEDTMQDGSYVHPPHFLASYLRCNATTASICSNNP